MTDDPIEQQLRRALQRRAAKVDVRPDTVALDQRLQVRAPRRWTAGALALAILVLPLAGVAIGRWTAPEGESEPGASIVAGGAPEGDGAERDAADAIGVTYGNGTALVVRLFARETPTLPVSAWRMNASSGFDCTSVVLVGTGEPMIAAAFPRAPGPTEVIATTFELFNGTVYAPYFVAVTGPQVTTVQSVGPEGVADSMTPVEGVAVVAGGPPNTVQGTSEEGEVIPASEVTPTDASTQMLCLTVDPVGPPSTTTTTLPPPDDRREARAAVIEAITTAYNGQLDPEERADVYEESEMFLELQDEVDETYAEQSAASEVHVDDLWFLGPTEAEVQFDILTNGRLNFMDQRGTVVLVDGEWVVSYETACLLFSYAGVTCPERP